MPEPAHLPTPADRASLASKFRVVAETEDYVVVDKPPFLLIHPSKPDGTPTQDLATFLFGTAVVAAALVPIAELFARQRRSPARHR